MTKLKELLLKLEKLSPKEINDLDNLVNAILKTPQLKSAKLKQNWAGGLKEFRTKYSSLELQKKALEWRKE